MTWNAATYEVLGGGSAHPTEVPAGLSELEHSIGSPLPGAVREWFAFGGDERLAGRVDNLITQVTDLADTDVAHFLSSGYLLLETDSQYCCRWVTPIASANEDPPVYLIDPDDYACNTRMRYADTFSSYTFTCAWDTALVLADDAIANFDHSLNPAALGQLRTQFVELPTTYGWAMNQTSDAVYRFEGPAQVALAVRGDTALWSVVRAPSPALGEAIARTLGVAI